MFINAPANPSRWKKIIYLSASVVLGLLLSLIVHALFEMSYLRWAEKNNFSVPFFGGCALPPVLQISLWLLGALSGFTLGRFWWRKVYVERIWAKKSKWHKN